MRDLDLFTAPTDAAQNLARLLIRFSNTDRLHGD